MNRDFEAGEPELGAGSTTWSDRFAGADEDQVVRLRRLDKVVAQALLELVIGLRHPLVLTLMLCPRTHDEDLQIAILGFGIAKDSPA